MRTSNRIGRLSSGLLFVALATFVGCGSSSSDNGGSGANAGTGASAGTGAQAGTGATGSGGSAGSQGNAKFDFQINNGKSYCRSTDGCDFSSNISVKDASGTVLGRSAGFCHTPCDTCEQLPCPGIACQVLHGEPVTAEQITWDGSYYQGGTCNGSTQCLTKLFAPPGKYTAVMCATPGDLVDDASLPSDLKACKPSGPQECVEVPFGFPSAQTVSGSLP